MVNRPNKEDERERHDNNSISKKIDRSLLSSKCILCHHCWFLFGLPSTCIHWHSCYDEENWHQHQHMQKAHHQQCVTITTKKTMPRSLKGKQEMCKHATSKKTPAALHHMGFATPSEAGSSQKIHASRALHLVFINTMLVLLDVATWQRTKLLWRTGCVCIDSSVRWQTAAVALFLLLFMSLTTFTWFKWQGWWWQWLWCNVSKRVLVFPFLKSTLLWC